MNSTEIVLSGMRPTGMLHLGHLRGVLRNWTDFQESYKCLYMVADWHALTTDYADPGKMEPATEEMVLCWLAAGIDPERSILFVQSAVPEHAELHLILSMVCPLPWLERMPTFKDQQQHLKDRDLNTYGFLGYPLLQSADILVYRAGLVPVGEDQVPHVEFSREMARRFNHMFGVDPDFSDKVERAVSKIGKTEAAQLERTARAFRETGDAAQLEKGVALVRGSANISKEEQAVLEAYMRGTRRQILPEPAVMLSKEAKIMGLDGRKMSKSYGNTIGLLEDAGSVGKRFLSMPTDPARVRRMDPGDPDKCPVWSFHEIYTSEEGRAEVRKGCTTAGIGCLDCKRLVLNEMEKELEPLRSAAEGFRKNRGYVKDILHNGSQRAGELAGETIEIVREAVGLVR